MSHTTVLEIVPGEKVVKIEELMNSWGAAPHVWDAISQRYYGQGVMWKPPEGFWDLWKDMKLSREERVVFAMTFDRVYVKRADYAEAAECIRKFFKLYPIDLGKVNHWPRIIEIFETTKAENIGFCWTSVSDNPFLGECVLKPAEELYDLFADINESEGEEK